MSSNKHRRHTPDQIRERDEGDKLLGPPSCAGTFRSLSRRGIAGLPVRR
jgi:hypothetical protein